MIRRVVAFLLTVQMLFGCVFLPLGDFSLLKQLPGMYQAYEKVAAPDELGLIDFLGDYLLNGKELLGHNQHDQQSNSGDLQFQHATSMVMLIQPLQQIIVPSLVLSGPGYPPVCLTVNLSDYHPALFRPPLV